jgi:hypothetical protein
VELTRNAINGCKCCEYLKTVLQEVTSELQSTKEIIKILQEDLHTYRPTGPSSASVQSSSTTENLTLTSPPSNNRIKIPYKKYRKPANNDKSAKFWSTSIINSNATSPNPKEHKPGDEAKRKPQPQTQTLVSHNLKKIHPKQTMKENNEIFPIPTILNHQISGEKSRNEPRQRTFTKEREKKQMENSRKGKTTLTTINRVVIIGDSHLKGSVERTGNYLSSGFEVSGLIKPGVGIENILGKKESGMYNLTKSDVLVCNGGANDVYNNNSKKALVQFGKFIQDNNNTNLIVIDIPHRHDQPYSSHMNEEIRYFHSKLKNIAKLYNHVMVLESNVSRNCFTHHGLHLNGLGKGLLAKQIASLIYKLNSKESKSPISLEWKVKLHDNKSTIHLDEKETISTVPVASQHQITAPVRSSARTKRPPITRESDFLW